MTATESPSVTARPGGGNPFVGPRSLTGEDALHGRARERRELANLVLADRIVLCYSPSGAGKTSLIQAGLIPDLQEEGIPALPVARAGRSPEGDGHNRYAASVLLSLGAPPEVAAGGTTLRSYLEANVPEDGRGLVIFDQFEEVLSLDPTDATAKRQFFAEVAEALQDRRWFAVFAMREDFLAALDPYVDLLPTRLATRFRLDLLDEKAARQVITGTAQDAHRTFAPDACDALITELSRLVDGRIGPYVEPVQLQVVCRRLWEQVPAATTEITKEHVQAAGDVTRALSAYYGDEVAEVALATSTPERVIRDWFDRELVTDRGYRGQAQAGPTGDVRVLRQLVDAHLVRAETRRGATWYELAHDRLVEPVRAGNRAWREQHLSAFQRQASLWDEHGRRDELVVVDEILDEGEKLAADPAAQLTQVEASFLAASRKAREAGERDRLAARKTRRWAGISTIGLVVALLASTLAVTQAMAFRRATSRAEAGERLRLAGPALDMVNADPNLSAQLALHALAGEEEVDDAGGVDAQEALYHRVFRTSRVGLTIPREGHRAVYAPDGNAIAVAGASGSAEFDVDDLTQVSELDDAPSLAIAYTPDGRALAVSGSNGAVMVWPRDGSDARGLLATDTRATVQALAFDADGGRLAVAAGEEVRVWSWESEAVGEGDEGESDEEGEEVQDELAGDGDTQVSSTSYGIRWHAAKGPGVTTLTGLVGGVRALAFDPAGTTLAAASADGAVRMLSPAAGGTSWEVSATLTGHRGLVNAVAFSPDGTHLLSGGDDGSARLWDVPSRQLRKELLGHESGINGVAFRADGRRVATAGDDGTAKVWDWALPRVVAETEGDSAVTSVAFRGDGTRLLLAVAGGAPAEWDVREELPPGHTAAVSSVAFSPEGDRVATASEDWSAAVWDLDGNELVRLTGHGDNVRAVAFGPGRRVATASWDGSARLWDADSGRTLQVFSGHTDALNDVALSRDGARLATAGSDGTARLWDTATGAELRAVGDGEFALTGVAFSPDGTVVVTMAEDASVTVWNAATGARVRDLPAGDDVADGGGVAVSPDGALVAGSTSEGTTIWDARTGQVRATFGSGLEVPHQVAFSPDGAVVLTGEGVARRVADGSAVTTLDAGAGAALSPDGRIAATAGWGPTATLWDSGTGQRRVTLGTPATTHIGSVIAMDADRTGRRLATASDDWLVVVWDARTGRAERRIPQEGRVNDVAFSPNGRRLVAVAEQGGAKVFDATSGELITNLPRAGEGGEGADEPGDIQFAEFGPDGQTVTTVGESLSGDGLFEAVVWNVSNGKALSRRSLGDAAEVLALSGDGKLLAVAGDDEGLSVVDARSGRRRGRVDQVGFVLLADFDPAGQRLVMVDEDGKVLLGDIGSGEVESLPSGPEFVTSLAFSQDGEAVAAGSYGRAVVWDAGNRRITHDIPAGADDTVIAFGPPGSFLAVSEVYTGKPPSSYPLDLAELRRRAEQATARSLVEEECRRYLQRAFPCEAKRSSG